MFSGGKVGRSEGGKVGSIFAGNRTQSHPGKPGSEAPDNPWHTNSFFLTEVNWIAF